jgi:RNA polymerase sigma-54 factor
MLKEQGIECARRTVAKYREALRIPVTSLRKAL